MCAKAGRGSKADHCKNGDGGKNSVHSLKSSLSGDLPNVLESIKGSFVCSL